MQTWQLPEHIADILPERARQLESVKEQILAQFRTHGFELVQPRRKSPSARRPTPPQRVCRAAGAVRAVLPMRRTRPCLYG